MIFVPKVCGTCFGATRAIELALASSKKGKKVVIYKEILHNKTIIENLKSKGVECVTDLSGLDKDTTVIIRAHGERKETYDYLESKGLQYEDATCPNVLKIHKIIKERFDNDYSIIIIGNSMHPEVIGSNGWCCDRAFVVENKKDVEKIKNLHSKVLLIAQTTVSEDLFKRLSKYIIKKFSNYDIECINTVCLAQKNIQSSSINVAKKSDYTFVIGGENSSNTRELYQKCAAVSNTHLFSNKNSMFAFMKQEEKINIDSKICITGGASTPKGQIEEYKNLADFYLHYKSIKERLENKMANVNNSFFDSRDNSIVADAINKFVSINCDGKYIRSFLIELGYSMKGRKDNYSDLLALAYETFQSSILVHDDIIDNAALRRGKDTIPKTYVKEFNKYVGVAGYKKNEGLDVANSLGICIGDLGYYYASQLIIDNYAKDKNFARILDYYNKTVINTIKGEIIDVYLPFKEKHLKNSIVKEDDILEIFKLKTSWYTIVGPFCLGMILSGATSEEISEMEDALLPIGVAFQIKDDILDIYSSKSDILKSTSDIAEFKQTLLYYYTINNNEYREKLLRFYGKEDLSLDEIDEVRNIFEESGARKYATDMMNSFFEDGKNKLDRLSIPRKHKNILFGFITYLELRSK